MTTTNEDLTLLKHSQRILERATIQAMTALDHFIMTNSEGGCRNDGARRDMTDHLKVSNIACKIAINLSLAARSLVALHQEMRAEAAAAAIEKVTLSAVERVREEQRMRKTFSKPPRKPSKPMPITSYEQAQRNELGKDAVAETIATERLGRVLSWPARR